MIFPFISRHWSRYSVVGSVTKLQAGQSRFRIPTGQDLISSPRRLEVLMPAQPPIQYMSRVLFNGDEPARSLSRPFSTRRGHTQLCLYFTKCHETEKTR